MCEFAKRYLYRQSAREGSPLVEITPFPLALVWAGESSVPLLVSAMHGEAKKGLVPVSGVPGAVRELDKILYPVKGPVHGFSHKRAYKRARIAYHCDAVLRLVQGGMAVENAVRVILDGHPLVQDFIDPEISLLLVKKACAELYRSSLNGSKTSGLNTRFVTDVTRLVATTRDPATLIAETLPAFPDQLRVTPDFLRELRSVPALGSFQSLERSMLDSLEEVGVDGVPLES